MKFQNVFLTLSLISPVAFATGGIECHAIDGTLEIRTTESRDEGEVLSMEVNAPWIKKEAMIFKREASEVAVTQEEVIRTYMAHNSEGVAVTLLIDNQKREGRLVSTAYMKDRDGISVETVVCSQN